MFKVFRVAKGVFLLDLDILAITDGENEKNALKDWVSFFNLILFDFFDS